MKIEIGGGIHPRGDGFLNVDIDESADIVCDLNAVPWPIEDGVVEEVYSSHCLEHLSNSIAALCEIARICKVGAKVVVRVPDPNSEGSFVSGHKTAIGEVFLRNVLEHFPGECWTRDDKILRLESVVRLPDPTWFPRARESHLFSEWTDDEIMLWVPRTCHEGEFTFSVRRINSVE